MSSPDVAVKKTRSPRHPTMAMTATAAMINLELLPLGATTSVTSLRPSAYHFLSIRPALSGLK